MIFEHWMWKSLKCTQNLHYFAPSHDRETMSFRNSAVTSFTFLLTALPQNSFKFSNGGIVQSWIKL